MNTYISPKTRGEPTIESLATGLGTLGRYGDNYMIHAAEGETVVPREILESNPGLKQDLFRQMQMAGIENPNRYVVGSELNSINPITGQPEFFFKKIFRAIKKVAKKAAPILAPIIGNMIMPGIGGLIASGLVTKLQGGSWGDALKSAAMSYAGSSLMSGISGGIGASGSGGSFGEGFMGGLEQGITAPWDAVSNLGGTFDQGILGSQARPVFGPQGDVWRPYSAEAGGQQIAGGPPVAASAPGAAPPASVDFYDAPGVETLGAGESLVPTGAGAGVDVPANFKPTDPRTWYNPEGTPPVDGSYKVAMAPGVKPPYWSPPTETPDYGGLGDFYSMDAGTTAAMSVPTSVLEPGDKGVFDRQTMRWKPDATDAQGNYYVVEANATDPMGKDTYRLVKPGYGEQTIAQDILGEGGLDVGLTGVDAAKWAERLKYGIPAAGLGAYYAMQPGEEDPRPSRGSRENDAYEEWQSIADKNSPEAIRLHRIWYGQPKYTRAEFEKITGTGSEQYPDWRFIPAAAGGGEVMGPGSGTSDSIPARLSDGEFVMTARAVENAGGGNRALGAARMYDMMNRFEHGSA